MSGTPAPAGSVNDQSYRAILDYLNRRGHSKAAAALTADLAAATSGTGSVEGGGKSVGLDDFADRNAPSQPRTPGATPAPSGGAAGAAARRRPDQQVAGGQLLADPPSWEKGYEGLRNFVENVSGFAVRCTAASPAELTSSLDALLAVVPRHPSTRAAPSSSTSVCPLLP